MAIADCLIAEQPPLRLEADGTIRVGASRVTLDVLLDAFKSGMTPQEIADDFTTVTLEDAYGAIAHYLRHKQEVDEYLDRRRLEAEELERTIEQQRPTAELRTRLRSAAKLVGRA